jgi:hypothetical protein
MIDLIKTVFITGFADLQESFYFWALVFLFCKFAKWVYKILMRMRFFKK